MDNLKVPHFKVISFSIFFSLFSCQLCVLPVGLIQFFHQQCSLGRPDLSSSHCHPQWFTEVATLILFYNIWIFWCLRVLLIWHHQGNISGMMCLLAAMIVVFFSLWYWGTYILRTSILIDLLLHSACLNHLNHCNPPRDVLTSRVWTAGPGQCALLHLISRRPTSLQQCGPTLQFAWWPEAVCIGRVKLDVDTLWQRSVSCQMLVRQTQAARFPRR